MLIFSGADFLLVVTEDYDIQGTSNVIIKKVSDAEIGSRIARALKYIEVENVMGLLARCA